MVPWQDIVSDLPARSGVEAQQLILASDVEQAVGENRSVPGRAGIQIGCKVRSRPAE